MRELHIAGTVYTNNKGLEYTLIKREKRKGTVKFTKSGYTTTKDITTIAAGNVKDVYSVIIGKNGVCNDLYIKLRTQYNNKKISSKDRRVYLSWRKLQYKELNGLIVIDPVWRDIEVYRDYYLETKPVTNEVTVLTYKFLQKYYDKPKWVGPDTALWLTPSVAMLLYKRYMNVSHLESAVLYRPSTDSYTVLSVDSRSILASGLNEREAEMMVMNVRDDVFKNNIDMLVGFDKKILTCIVDEYKEMNKFKIKK